LHDDARLAAMSQAAAVSGNPRADADLAELVMSVGWKRPGRRRLPKGQQPSSASRHPAEHGRHSPEGGHSPEGRQPGGQAATL
jgi:hypothetical protein